MNQTKPLRTSPLNRNLVLTAALALIDREGLEALTMRRLGTELGIEAMSLYNHVKDRSDLLDGLVELLIGEGPTPRGPRGPWDRQLFRLFKSYYATLRLHPALLPVIATRPANTIAALAAVERGLAILHDAGFPDRAAIYSLDCISAFVVGHALLDVGNAPLGLQPHEPLARRPVIRDLAPDQFPHLLRSAHALAHRDPRAEFDLGLAALIAGLGSLKPARGKRRTR